jgi:apolipoprotein N-acyltransferase
VRLLQLPRGDWPFVIGAALLTAAAYPPFHLFIPSFVCLVPVVWLLLAADTDTRPVRRQFALGFWYGVLAHGLTLYWMVPALWRFTPLSGLVYLATIAVLALYVAVALAASGWTARQTRIGVVVTLPVFWTAAEWLIAHQGPLRFPWLGLGTSLTGFPVVVQIAELIGARGVTFLLVLANVVLALAWLHRRDRRRVLLATVGVTLGLLLVLGYGIVRVRTLAMRELGNVALLQPNVHSIEKWAPEAADSVVDRTVELAERAMAGGVPDLVVWPETSVPGYLRQRIQWHSVIRSLSLAMRIPQVVGALDQVQLDDGRYGYFNAAFLIDSLGRLTEPPYRKRHLVPGIERIPFLDARWFGSRFLGGFSRGTDQPLYDIGLGRFGVLICFESLFERQVRQYRANGADFAVNITNDEWFGRTSAPYQHAAHLVMRAIENRIGIARAANSGISEVVDPLGHTRGRAPLLTRAVVIEPLATSDALPLYVRWGDWVGGLALLLAAAFTVLGLRGRS